MKITTLLLAALAALVAAVALAGILISKKRTWQGLLLGMFPIAAMELLQWMSLRPKVRSCLDAACAAAGLPPGCPIDSYGCTEWTGIAALFYLVVGIVDLLLYLVAAVVMIMVFRRRRMRASERDAAADA